MRLTNSNSNVLQKYRRPHGNLSSKNASVFHVIGLRTRAMKDGRPADMA